MAIACAAMAFTSCADKEMCYKVTVTTKILGIENSSTSYHRATKNDIKEVEERLRAAAVAAGADKNTIKVSSVAVPDTNCQ